LLLASTFACIGITIGFLETGYTIIFQNLFYVPIILACFFYLKRGFLFSCVLSLIYFSLMIIYNMNALIAIEAGIRVIIFIGVAGVVTYLSETIKRTECDLRIALTSQEESISDAKVCFMAFDSDGIFHQWNTAAEKMSGYPKEEVIGKNTLWNLMFPEPRYREQFREKVTQALYSGEESNSFEFCIRTKDGQPRIIAFNIKETPAKGKTRRFNLIGIDITEKRQYLLELKKSEERWGETFTRNLHPIAILRKVKEQDDYVFSEINPALEKVENVRREEIIGRKITEVFPGVKEFGLLDVLNQVHKTGIPGHHDLTYYKDDRIEGWRDNWVFPLSSGEIVTMYADVTERELAEAKIRKQKEYLDSLISIANVPIITWNSSFEITRINQAYEDLTGWRSDEVMGKTLEIFIPEGQNEKIMSILEPTVRGDKLQNKEMEIMRKDGSVRTVVWNSATLLSEDGNPVAVIAQGRDITEEKKLRLLNDQALTQIEKNMAQLAVLNDEIRNPLTIIMGHVELYLDEEHIDEITRQVSRIDDIVTNIDKRWNCSEKVLNSMRKYYHLRLSGSNDEKELILPSVHE
jgi:PAS domain S-box-containing protein